MRNLKQVVLVTILGICLIATAFTTPIENAIVGKWEEESGVRTIEIYKSKNQFFGRILKNDHQEDDQLTPGKIFMKNFEYDAGDELWNGMVNLPAKDMTLKAKIVLENQNEIKSTARWGFISKSKIWKRVK